MLAVRIYPIDTVAVALSDLKSGTSVIVENETIKLLEDIPNGHKFALQDIQIGEDVLKYGNSIGLATENIKTGCYVHDHNIETKANNKKEYSYNYNTESILPGKSKDVFMGYSRKDNMAGIRNHLALIPTVFCANGPLQKLGKMLETRFPQNENFDGILSLTHPYGCSQTGNDLAMTATTLSGIIRNPNFGGVLVVSLGCEINDLITLKKHLGEVDDKRVKFLVLQESDDEFEDGIQLCDEIMSEVYKDRREPQSFNKLHISVNCGGSDGFSGITANKMIGKITEEFVKRGGTVNMTEVPEMFGAEHLLMNRAVNEEVFDDQVSMINNYNDYFARYGEKVSDNPTQGNKAGGLSTIEEKSLGCIQKGGLCAVTEVLKYGERASKNGYILVSGPGNDLTGVTGQIAAGSVLTLFTTGRGTPCGFAGPTFRLSSNNYLAKKKSGWIDYNAGILLDNPGEENLDKFTKELFSQIVATCNGEYKTKNEVNGYYQMSFLRDGVTL